MPPVTCQEGQIGPFTVFSNENWVSSINPETATVVGGTIQTQKIGTKEVCLDAEYKDGVLHTKYFDITGVPLNQKLFSTIWENGSPWAPTAHFSMLFTSYIASDYFNMLGALQVFDAGLENILHKRIPLDVSKQPIANAAFIPQQYGIFFGFIPHGCHTGADGDIVVHELKHLLTFSTNPFLGMTPGNAEGMAMHETLSDIIPALLFLDKETAESVTQCFGISDSVSPNIGLRTVDSNQPSLFYDKESHGRTALYSPFLWDMFKVFSREYVGQGIEEGDAVLKARDLMFIVVHNMSEFLPANPTKTDFVKAFYHALIDFSTRPDASKYAFDPTRIKAAMIDKAKWAQILKTKEDLAAALEIYPVIKDPASEIQKRINGDTTFQVSLKVGRLINVTQFYKGKPIIGHGIKFINTRSGTVMIDTTIDPSKLSSGVQLQPAKAWEMLQSVNSLTHTEKLLEPQLSAGTMRKKELPKILSSIQGLKGVKMPNPRLVYLSGKQNMQYEFKIEGKFTIYVDAVDGSLSIISNKFH